MKQLIQGTLSKKVIQLLSIITEVADRGGYTAYVVGGFVRDLLLKIDSNDIDVVVEGNGLVYADALSKRLAGNLRLHKRFRTAVITISDGRKIDVVTARKEYYAHPAALPTIEQGTIKDDLARRDFTINAMTIALNGKNAYRLLDPFEGEKDVKERRIRVLHAQSFIDDPTRVFRAIKFEQRFGFAMDGQTRRLAKEAVKQDFVQRLSGKRVFAEIKSMLSERRPVNYIKKMKKFDLVKYIFPAIIISEEKVRLLNAVEKSMEEDWLLYFSVLLDGVNLNGVNDICKRFSMPKKDKKRLLAILQD